MNLVFSYGSDKDFELAEEGNEFLGAGLDKDGHEVHVFRMAGKTLVPMTRLQTEERQGRFSTCYFCEAEVPDRDGFPADPFNGGDGGTACKKCAMERTWPGSPKEDE